MPKAGDKFKRELSLASSPINEEARTVELAFSSEEPVDRIFGREILDHAVESVDLERLNNAAPLLLNHDPDRQIGVVEKAWVDDDRRGRALVRFSKSDLGTEVFQDVVDGIRGLVSVSYTVGEWEEQKGQAKEASTFRAVSWTPHEVSIVSIPADNTVGVGRSIETETQKPEPQEEKIKMEKPEIEIKEVPDKRAEKIAQLGRDFGATNEAVEAIATGKSVDEFTNELLAKRSVKPAAPKPEVKLDAKERKQYSLLRALRSAAEGKLEGFEKEVSDECQKRSGTSTAGFIVPWDALSRDLTAGTASAGGNTVQTDVLAGSFIEALRNRTLADRVGATFLNGLQGDVAIPKMSAAAGTEWNSSETDATAQSDATFAQVTMSPKHLSALTGYSKQLLAQSSIDLEAVVRDDLAASLAVALDAAAFNGTGLSGQPTGILNTSGIGSVTSSGTVTHTHVVNLEKEVEVDAALNGSLFYVMNPAEKVTLKTTEAASGTAVFLMEDGEVNGYPAISSNQVPSGNIVFGNFNDLLIGTFGAGLDITVDPYSQSASRIVRIVACLMTDIAVRHAQSFAAITDA